MLGFFSSCKHVITSRRPVHAVNMWQWVCTVPEKCNIQMTVLYMEYNAKNNCNSKKKLISDNIIMFYIKLYIHI